jgi:hypothetical protein
MLADDEDEMFCVAVVVDSDLNNWEKDMLIWNSFEHMSDNLNLSMSERRYSDKKFERTVSRGFKALMKLLKFKYHKDADKDSGWRSYYISIAECEYSNERAIYEAIIKKVGILLDECVDDVHLMRACLWWKTYHHYWGESLYPIQICKE